MRLDKSDIRYVIDYIKYIFFIIIALYSKVFKCFILFHSKASKNMNYWLSSTACAKNFILVDILFWILLSFCLIRKCYENYSLFCRKCKWISKRLYAIIKRKEYAFYHQIYKKKGCL